MFSLVQKGGQPPRILQVALREQLVGRMARQVELRIPFPQQPAVLCEKFRYCGRNVQSVSIEDGREFRCAFRDCHVFAHLTTTRYATDRASEYDYGRSRRSRADRFASAHLLNISYEDKVR